MGQILHITEIGSIIVFSLKPCLSEHKHDAHYTRKCDRPAQSSLLLFRRNTVSLFCIRGPITLFVSGDPLWRCVRVCVCGGGGAFNTIIDIKITALRGVIVGVGVGEGAFNTMASLA